MFKQAKNPLLFVLALILLVSPLQSLMAKTASAGVAQDDCAMAYEQMDGSAGHDMVMTSSEHCNTDSQCSDGDECRQNHCASAALSIAVDSSDSPVMASNELISHSDLHLQDSLRISPYRPPRF
jgi:uncharacterized protein involved in copper resistance